MLRPQSAPVYIVLLCMLALSGLGLVMIASTTAPLAQSSNLIQKQALWFTVAWLGFAVVGWTDYRIWRKWALPLFAVTLILLPLVFFPGVGGRVKGAYRWINLPLGFKIQPSEFFRIAWVIFLAHWLSKYQKKIRDWKKGFWMPLAFMVPAIVILRIEPDFGTLILVLITTLTMMFVAGARFWPIVGLGTLSTVVFALTLWMLPERRARILAFLEPELHKEGKSYQIWQGMLALASGGTKGLGLGNSLQKMSYIPEATTDSILPIIGEELGLYVVLGIVLAYVLILIFGLSISLRSLDSFGLLMGLGLVLGLAFQAIINIATVTGSMPAKGMPLPFVSYGGSNLVISCVAMGFLVSIHRQTLRFQKQSQGLSIDEKTPHI